MDTLYTALAHAPALPPAPVTAYLCRIGFTDSIRVWSMLQQINRRVAGLAPPLQALPGTVFQAITLSYDPERAFNNLFRLLTETDDASAGAMLRMLIHQPDSRDALLAICAGSQPLSAILIQDPSFLLELFADDAWRSLRNRDRLQNTLLRHLGEAPSFEEGLARLRTYKKREYLRIALCDLMKQAETRDVLLRLSDVADLCLQSAYEICARHLEERHGQPQLEGGRPSGFAIVGMGKLGGQELNFNSDIDLLYVYDSTEGRTSLSGLSTYEYYPKLARMVTDFISRITEDGLVFRVDLRLRPEGRAGDIANSVDGYRWHYESHGQIWERQALIKARPAAGSPAAGHQFLKAVQGYVFHPEHDPLILHDINHMREKIAHALLERGSGAHHVKLGPGGIREIEFIVQGFQLVYAGQQGWPWERSTLRALACIAARGYLTENETADLRDAYLFLRDLENRIQMAAGRQTHEIPDDLHAQAVLARMMGFREETDERTAAALLSRYHAHTFRVRSIYERVFHSAM
jgi:glutamate-ammonia-ligase adenylyltransferase